jgi:Holliday junction resolvase
MSNKKSGTDFEREFCKLAAKEGFWAHMLTANANGQPSDAIISKNGIPVLIDCKDCEHDVFPISRIEENQELAMKRWLETGNQHAFFALNVRAGVVMVHFNVIQALKKRGYMSLNSDQIVKIGRVFKDWEEYYFANNN